MANNSKMILNLFAGLQDALFLGDGFDQGQFVSFMQPGQFVSLNLKQQMNSDDMAIQSDIANVLLDTSFVNKYQDISYSGSAELPGSVSQVYYDMMEHEALPYKELSPDVLAQISTLTTWLENNSDNYNKYGDLYYQLVDALNVEQHKPTPDPVVINQLIRKRGQAYTSWQTFGQKDTYESNLAQLIYLTSESPVTFWTKLKTQMEQSKETAPNLGDYYPVYFEPPIAQWSNDSAWAHFEQQISENDSYQYSKETGWSGGISVGWGLWSFGGGASGSSKYTYQQSDASNVNLKFDYLRVRINRNKWLLADTFGYKFWTWNKAFGGENISDGGSLFTNPPLRPVGRMPVLPNYLILVRNLELTASFSQQDIETYSKQIQSSVSFGWGPFSFSGTYQEAENSVSVKSTFDGVSIKVAQPQIIARSSIFLPKSPDPNLGLNWQDDACLPGDPCWQPRLAFGSDIRKNDYEKLVYDGQLNSELAKAEKVKQMWLNQRLAMINPGQ